MSRVMPLVAPLMFAIMQQCGQQCGRNAWAHCGKGAAKMWTKSRMGVQDLLQQAKSRQEAPPMPSGREIPGAHHGIYCNGCKQFPIVGVRFKCTVRPDFDLCAACEAKDTQMYPMIKMRAPDRKDIHYNVACDMCNVQPIVGVRFKCTVRPNYDLCAECEAKDTEEYPMIKMRVASQFSRRRGCGGRGHGRVHGRGFGGRAYGRRGYAAHGPWKRGGGRGRGHWRRFMRMMCEQPSMAEQKVNELPSGTLSFGARGPHVAYLQQVLIQLGFMDQSAIRWHAGFYGPRTTEAIAKVASAMGSDNAQEVQGVFTSGVREYLLKQLSSVQAPQPEEAEEAGMAAEPVVVSPPRSHRQSLPVALHGLADAPAPAQESAQEPVAQEPVAQEPVAQEPVVQEPVAQEPVAQEPVVQEPVAQEPVVQEPVVQEPVAQEPVQPVAPQQAPHELLDASPFAIQLQVLQAMGFRDRDRATMLEVLERNAGNLEASIDWLLNH